MTVSVCSLCDCFAIEAFTRLAWRNKYANVVLHDMIPSRMIRDTVIKALGVSTSPKRMVDQFKFIQFISSLGTPNRATKEDIIFTDGDARESVTGNPRVKLDESLLTLDTYVTKLRMTWSSRCDCMFYLPNY